MRPTFRPTGTFTSRANVRRPRTDNDTKDRYGHTERVVNPDEAGSVGIMKCSFWTKSVMKFADDGRAVRNIFYGVMLPVGSDIRNEDFVRIEDRTGRPQTDWLVVDDVEPHVPSHITVWAVQYGT